LLLIQEND